MGDTIKINLAAVAPKPWLDGAQLDSLFRQEDIWIDRYLETYQIVAMTDRHLMFTHRFVRRNWWRWWNYTTLSWLFEPPMFGVSGPGRLLDPLPTNVRETPLFKALDHELRHRQIEELVT